MLTPMQDQERAANGKRIEAPFAAQFEAAGAALPNMTLTQPDLLLRPFPYSEESGRRTACSRLARRPMG